MANTIALAKKYIPLLDEVYKAAAKTSVLDAPAELVRESMNANEILIPKISLQGLGNYSRATGFVDGDVTFAWQTHAFTQDRGRTFTIDAFDDEETLNVAFGATTSQFIRTQVVPEIDAYRFATISAKVAAGNIATPATLSATTALQAIDTGFEKLLEAEVELDATVLFLSPAIYTFLKQSNLITRQFMTNVGQSVLSTDVEVLNGVPVVVVPQSRFYTAIDLRTGGAGQEAGGFAKAVAGKDINFMLIDTRAVLGVTKTALPRIFDPLTNQKAHAWKFDYRLYHDMFVPDNKITGVYLHNKA